jgi:hypothetical protein
LHGDPRGTLNRIREAMIDRGARRLRSRVPAIWIRTFEAGRS